MVNSKKLSLTIYNTNNRNTLYDLEIRNFAKKYLYNLCLFVTTMKFQCTNILYP